MSPRDDASSAKPLAAARLALERGDLPAATRHLASVLSEDPNRADALALLDEILAAADDPLDLLPNDDLPATSGLKAVHAYILADQGRVPEAVDLLLELVGDRPDVLYIDWLLGWLQRPEAAGRLDMEKMTNFVGSLVEQFPALTAPHGGGRDTLARMPLFIQLVRRTQPADGHFLAAGVALLRRLGNLDEALKLAREAYGLEPGLATAHALAATHAARNELDQALQVYRDTISQEPGDVSARLSMADLLAHHGRLQEAEALYAEVLEQEPEQECARPSYYFLRFVATNEEPWRDKLLALAEQEPENERAQRLAQRLTPFVGYLPDPPDVTATLQRPPGETGNKAVLPYLEAPSNFLAFDWLRKLDVTVLRVQKPDPRLPRCRVDYLLWRYDGTDPRVALSTPTSGVAHTVAELAAQPYQLEVWWPHARRLAQEFGPDKVEDLLAALVYPPGVAQASRPAAWVYRFQVAVALVLAHLDHGWEDSVRRKALLSLANGPMDWTLDAALVALATLARDEEDTAEEIGRLFRELRQRLPEDGTVSHYPALMWCSLRLPHVPEEEQTEIRTKLRRWQDVREAQRHLRQARAQAARGEYEPALAELTEALRLDPDSVEALRERAALALRRANPAQAQEDFSRAIEMQPGAAADHLGRGQARLRLGRFDEALADFTEAARLAPWDWQPLYRRGLAHAARKQHEQAVADFSEVIRLVPEQPEGYLQRALAYTQLGQLDRAIADYTEQIGLNPEASLPYNFRARLYYRQGNHSAALADYLRASELDPGNANTHSQLAWIWATSPEDSVRDAARALAAAQKACELTEGKKAHCVDALAAAQAESGNFEEAVRSAEQAVALAPEGEKATYQARLESYRQGQSWRDR